MCDLDVITAGALHPPFRSHVKCDLSIPCISWEKLSLGRLTMMSEGIDGTRAGVVALAEVPVGTRVESSNKLRSN